MNHPFSPHALFYPFHLCHPRTVDGLLARFRTIHFRDFMAFQLTSMTGMTAFQDRMSLTLPHLLTSGRLIEGHCVSGPLPPLVAAAIDRDLHDPTWRAIFHAAFCSDYRLQHGLFDLTQHFRIGGYPVLGQTVHQHLTALCYRDLPYNLAQVRLWSRKTATLTEEYQFEYGLALIKTSAALIYTHTLAATHSLHPVTDSPAHFTLYAQSCIREDWPTLNHLLIRTGY